jgi:hypothetical protein
MRKWGQKENKLQAEEPLKGKKISLAKTQLRQIRTWECRSSLLQPGHR